VENRNLSGENCDPRHIAFHYIFMRCNW